MFGRSAGRTSVLDDLACDGSEERLMDCPHPGATVEDCQTPFADASVICRTSGVCGWCVRVCVCVCVCVVNSES